MRSLGPAAAIVVGQQLLLPSTEPGGRRYLWGLAGPDLTAETFARGMFRIPPAGAGVWRRAHAGERFIVDDALVPDPFGDPAGTVTVVDELLDADRPPDYPPPTTSDRLGRLIQEPR